jgi:NNP family nitrate/nitrite transporter-like MFS transporter
MIVPGLALFAIGIAYRLATQDTPAGNYEVLHARGERTHEDRGKLRDIVTDRRVWALFVIYGACFGVELTINNVAALYFHDEFGLSVATAGVVAGLFGLMNLFARTLGGVFGDRAGIRWGLRGRVGFLGAVLFAEGITLMIFSQMQLLPVAIVALVIFSLFVQMSEGATYSVVPFVNRKSLGMVSGIVGAGGNAGAVAAGFLFRSESLTTQTAFLILGVVVAGSASLALLVRFSERDEAEANHEMAASLARRAEGLPA